MNIAWESLFTIWVRYPVAPIPLFIFGGERQRGESRREDLRSLNKDVTRRFSYAKMSRILI